jgi:hypothetical protein
MAAVPFVRGVARPRSIAMDVTSAMPIPKAPTGSKFSVTFVILVD